MELQNASDAAALSLTPCPRNASLRALQATCSASPLQAKAPALLVMPIVEPVVVVAVALGVEMGVAVGPAGDAAAVVVVSVPELAVVAQELHMTGQPSRSPRPINGASHCCGLYSAVHSAGSVFPLQRRVAVLVVVELVVEVVLVLVVEEDEVVAVLEVVVVDVDEVVVVLVVVLVLVELDAVLDDDVVVVELVLVVVVVDVDVVVHPSSKAGPLTRFAHAGGVDFGAPVWRRN